MYFDEVRSLGLVCERPSRGLTCMQAEEWDEATEAQVRAMEEQAATKAPAPARVLPCSPPQLNKPAFPATLPSIFNPTSFRLPSSKPAAQITLKPKASIHKPSSKATAKAKPRASTGNSIGLSFAAPPQSRDPSAEEGEGDGSNQLAAPKNRSKLPPTFPSVNTESIGAPFIDLDKADTWIYPCALHASFLCVFITSVHACHRDL